MIVLFNFLIPYLIFRLIHYAVESFVLCEPSVEKKPRLDDHIAVHSYGMQLALLSINSKRYPIVEMKKKLSIFELQAHSSSGGSIETSILNRFWAANQKQTEWNQIKWQHQQQQILLNFVHCSIFSVYMICWSIFLFYAPIRRKSISSVKTMMLYL